MKDCIFCKIINGELPGKFIYEDDLIAIIMNINPATNGHLLVIPKKHYENIIDTPNEIITHSMNIIREKIYPFLKERLNCKGLTISQNNELGQEIKHFHIHLTPRYDNDLLDFNYNKDMLKTLDEVYNDLNK